MHENAFLAGIFGGFLVELLHWFKIRRSDIPEYAKRWIYWLITILMMLCGGVLAFIYSRSFEGLNTIVAMNVGASAPLIIQKLSGSSSEEEAYILGDSDKSESIKNRINVRAFLRG